MFPLGEKVDYTSLRNYIDTSEGLHLLRDTKPQHPSLLQGGKMLLSHSLGFLIWEMGSRKRIKCNILTDQDARELAQQVNVLAERL